MCVWGGECVCGGVRVCVGGGVETFQMMRINKSKIYSRYNLSFCSLGSWATRIYNPWSVPLLSLKYEL